MTTRTRTRSASVPAYYLGRPAAIWLAASAQRRRIVHHRPHGCAREDTGGQPWSSVRAWRRPRLR